MIREDEAPLSITFVVRFSSRSAPPPQTLLPREHRYPSKTIDIARSSQTWPSVSPGWAPSRVVPFPLVITTSGRGNPAHPHNGPSAPPNPMIPMVETRYPNTTSNNHGRFLVSIPASRTESLGQTNHRSLVTTRGPRDPSSAPLAGASGCGLWPSSGERRARLCGPCIPASAHALCVDNGAFGRRNRACSRRSDHAESACAIPRVSSWWTARPFPSHHR
ncbi:Hypothetical protein A7982_01051 [Minicystis rosea]|nr:Hypothetical protein A7982_01051 [Minicystis rosea]